MSGIAGVFHADDRPAEAGLVARMARALAHRGPDGEACWVSGPIGLAHRRLASAAMEDKPPLVDAEGRALVVDGRLDDPLEMFRRRGAAFVDGALGEFAVAVWDAPARTLVCARDAFGVKPLYFHWDGRRVLFASEVGALFQDPSVPRRPDAATIADYLMMDFGDPGATFFDGIRRVPPGHVLTAGARGLALRRHWTPDGATRGGGPDDHARELAARFHAAVSDRLADAPAAGVLLSGGIDSTLVAAAAGAIRGGDRSIAALIYLHDGFLVEDWEAIAALAGAGAISPPRTRAGLPLLDMLLASAEPPNDESHPVLDPLLDPRAAPEFRVLLTGIGGDQLSSAGERGALADRLCAGRIVSTWREATALARAYGGEGRLATADALWSALPWRLRRTARALAGRAAPAWLVPRVARLRRPPLDDGVRFETRMGAAIWRALTAPQLAFALEKLDAEAARLGIEPRHPYLDRRVAESVLAIPPDVFVGQGYRKQFVQRALGGGLPLRTVERQVEQVPFRAPAIALRDEAEALERELFRPVALVFEYVDRACAERMRDDYLAGRGRHGARLWSFLLLAAWLRRTFGS
jgi:asparagine synthase (glutamine-hydrolysing)